MDIDINIDTSINDLNIYLFDHNIVYTKKSDAEAEIKILIKRELEYRFKKRTIYLIKKWKKRELDI